MQFRQVSALTVLLGVREPLGQRAQRVVHTAGEAEQIREHAEERAAHQAGADRTLHGEAVREQIDPLVEPAHRGERRALERAAPFTFLRKPEFAAERDDLVANRQRLGGLAADQVHALRDEQGEDERHRLALGACELERLSRASLGAIGVAEDPERPARHRARDHAGVEAVHVV